ncbi:MAG: hypothetical protein HY939_05800 [Gammaproteobacteria bacterium]|nr:hypothetical protein [Gammaproteobacteria bacterium]
MPWVYDPHSGGIKIPPAQHNMLRCQAEAFAKTRPWFSKYKLILRFKNQFCYLDAMERKDEKLFPIGRLRHFRENAWSLAFYTYSNERYEPCLFQSGKWEGTLEEAIGVCEMYLN